MPPPPDADPWPPAAAALGLYAPPLLRAVAGKLVRPRNQWSPEQLQEKILEGLRDTVVVDRALRAVSADARRLLRLAGLFDRTRWPVALLVDLLAAGDEPPSVSPLAELMESGLLVPELKPGRAELAAFVDWFPTDIAQARYALIPPTVLARAAREPLPPLTLAATRADGTPREADGFEWLIRATVVWQMAKETPFRLTQTGGFYKRDYDRLLIDPRLAATPPDELEPLGESGLFVAALARSLGIAAETEDGLAAGELPAAWDAPTAVAVRQAWSALPGIDRWGLEAAAPHPARWVAATAFAVAGLQTLPVGAWANLDELATAIIAARPHLGQRFDQTGFPNLVRRIVLAILFPLGVVRATPDGDGWRVQLSAWARALGQPEPPPPAAAAMATLFVQPNLEIVLYRQGLTPDLLRHLARTAEWKQLGLACMLHLTPESVYRGLEAGESFAEIVRWLERGSGRALPGNVLESLRTWASRRERVQVFGAAVVLEFATPTDLDRAVQAGVVDVRLTDRLGLVAQEGQLKYDQLRLVGSRDYTSPDEHCVRWDGDRQELVVDSQRSDLLAEPEVAQFADRRPPSPADPSPAYRLSLESARRGVEVGWTESVTEGWFLRRTGMPTPSAVRLLMGFLPTGTAAAERMLVVRLPDVAAAEGVAQWGETRGCVRERLGPTLLAIHPERLAEFRAALGRLGIEVQGPAEA